MPDYELVNISEIITALKVIKEECEKHSRCLNCPFFIEDTCGIKKENPEKWNIASNYIWRALK